MASVNFQTFFELIRYYRMMMLSQDRTNFSEGLNYLKNVIQKIMKTSFYVVLKGMAEPRHEEIMAFVNKENRKQIDQFLNADHFQFDINHGQFKDDDDIKPQTSRFTHIPITNTKRSSLALAKQNINSVSVSLHTSTKQLKRPSNSNNIKIPKNVVPLWAQGWLGTQEDSDQEDFANRIRERKTKRQIFRTRLEDTTQLKKETMPKNEEKNKKSQSKSQKKDKFHYLSHFVEMEVNLDEPFAKISPQVAKNRNKIDVKVAHKRESQSLRTSPIKPAHSKQLIFTTRKWQPLISQNRQLILQNSQKMKLTPGVTVRESLNKTTAYMPNSSSTRKKIQFLKNSEGNPLRLKFNELLSFKRLGSLTHLAYCSSMKTVKDLKESTDTNISIDSKQLLGDETDSRRLIKIANRRVFEQLMFQQDNPASESVKNRNRTKLKKEGKVRFDNMNQS